MPQSIRMLVTLAQLVVLALPVLAQDVDLERAQELAKAGDYAEAAKMYAVAVEDEPDNGQLWFRYAANLQFANQLEKAVEAWDKTISLGFAPHVGNYNKACAHALLGQDERAYAALSAAIDNGFVDVEKMKLDEDLSDLHGTARFADLMDKADRAAFPCKHNESCRQFDFWVGEWDVYNPQGTRVGTNKITKMLNGCLILEEWDGVLGTSGKSFNYYNPATDRWEQRWVSSRGGIVWYVGEFRDGSMVMEGESINADGEVTLGRVTFTPNDDGTVQQIIERSTDGGQTWTVGFNGRYVRQGTEQAYR